jgi:hypothetical protein
MTDRTSSKSRMTWQTGLVIGVFICLGIFGMSLFNLVKKVEENREQRVEEFVDNLTQGNYDSAYDMVSSEWKVVLENANGLEQAFTDIIITDVNFGMDFGNCTTNLVYENGNRRVTNDSKQYSYSDGTAKVNGDTKSIRVEFAHELGSAKILAIEFDDYNIGLEIPEGCSYSTD